MIRLNKWEKINEDTFRMKVVNGWLYKVITSSNAVSLCFIPDFK